MRLSALLRTVAGSGQPSRGGRRIQQDEREGIRTSRFGVRDGTGLVGPLVIPGVTSCLDDC
jgi:hypothetical protein